MKGLRDVGIALSVANLLFYPVWAVLLPGCYGHYYLRTPPGLSLNLGMMLVVLLVACALWLGSRIVHLAGQSPALRILGTMAFLAVFLLALNGVRYHAIRFAPITPFDQAELLSRIDRFLLRPAALLGALLLLTRWRARIVRAAMGLALLFLPFAAVTFSQAAWASVRASAGIPFPEFLDQPPAPPLPTKPGTPRVVWLLFDGLDQRLAFDERPPGLDLPNLDRLRRQALYASSAYPPAGNTRESIPSLLTGVQYAYIRPVRANDMFIQFDNTGQTGLWSAQPNVFSRARELGLNTALVGYYHPYGRVIGRHLTKCFWTTAYWDPLGMDEPDLALAGAISRILATEADRILASLPFVWRLGLLRPPGDPSRPSRDRSVTDHVNNYLRILDEARDAAGDPAFGLVFIHWPVPHHPLIYDRRAGGFSQGLETTYADNLALVDRTVGEIRDLLEASGLWEGTALLITSDHAFERREERVPFLLRMPGQREAVLIGQSFNTLVTADLLLALLSGKVSDPEGVVSWLKSR